MGIAESNMISVAQIFKNGFYSHSGCLGQFGVTRAISLYDGQPVSGSCYRDVFACGAAGCSGGASHQATTYFAAVSAIPHTVVITPSCSDEATL